MSYNFNSKRKLPLYLNFIWFQNSILYLKWIRLLQIHCRLFIPYSGKNWKCKSVNSLKFYTVYKKKLIFSKNYVYNQNTYRVLILFLEALIRYTTRLWFYQLVLLTCRLGYTSKDLQYHPLENKNTQGNLYSFNVSD